MTYNLERFIKVQERQYKKAYEEIKNGKKLTHWMWYIFPQIKGLGSSDYALYYGIESLDEAKAFWDNDYLRDNLTNITLCLLSLENKTAIDIFGYIDSLKLKSSMTLFFLATKDEMFKNVLEKYFDSEEDQNTIKILDTSNLF